MRFAIWGDLGPLAPVAEAIVRGGEHAVVGAVACGDWAVDRLGPAPPDWSDWSALVGRSDVDALLVGVSGGVDDESWHRVLPAVGAAVIGFDGSEDLGRLYEWTLAVHDKSLVLYPVFDFTDEPIWDHPAVRQALEVRWDLLQWEDGTLARAAWGRHGGNGGGHADSGRSDPAAAASGTQPCVDLPTIRARLVHAADVLLRLGGPFERVAAVAGGPGEGSVTTATVSLSAADAPAAVWLASTTLPVVGQIDGAACRAVVTISAGRWNVRIELPETGPSRLLAPGDFSDATATSLSERQADDAAKVRDRAERILSRFAELVAARREEPQRAERLWQHAVRAFEVAWAAERALRRGRSVELHFETASERTQFKSHMTAAGCSLLFLTLLFLIASLIVAPMLDPRSTLERRAAAAEFVFDEDDFVPNAPLLNERGKRHVREVASRLGAVDAPVVVAQHSARQITPLDQLRRRTVIEALQAAGVRAAAERVFLAPVTDPQRLWLLKTLRWLWAVPLLVFLALQVLIVLARPARREHPRTEPCIAADD